MSSRDSAVSAGCRRIILLTNWCIALFLLIAAGAKLWSGYEKALAVHSFVYHAAAILELVLAGLIMLIPKARRLAFWSVALLCLAGSFYSYWLVDRRPCGCLGSVWVFDNAVHAAINGIVGLASILVAGRCRD